MKTVFMFAGQGSQNVGMGADFYENSEEYKALVDSNPDYQAYQKLMSDGPIEELSKTENTQPCMSLFATGVVAELKKKGITPDAACGLSLGEYGALYVAGVIGADEYIKLTAFRGNAMMKAAAGMECSMSAIIGMEPEVVKAACDTVMKENEVNGSPDFVTVANYNCPGQYAICGDEAAVSKVEAILKEKGAKRMVRVNVSGPFHTKYMQPAGDALKDYFETISFEEPKIPVVANFTGEFIEAGTDVATIKDLLVKQVQNSVQFEKTMYTLLDAGYDRFIEIGPGKTLSGFMKRALKAKGVEAEIITIANYEDLSKL